MAKKAGESGFRPITVEDHQALGRSHAERKVTAVNDALQFPVGEAFDRDLTEILAGGAEGLRASRRPKTPSGTPKGSLPEGAVSACAD